jgi:group I intron endonuclease
MKRLGKCFIEGCCKNIYAKQMCRTHYMRKWRTGSVEPAIQPIKQTSFGIYKIECNEDCYIGGTTKPFHLRWRNHLHELRAKTHHNSLLQNLFDKYGEDSFKFTILEEVENKADVMLIEQKYIDLLKPALNIILSQDDLKKILIQSNISRTGTRHSEAAKLKMRLSWLRRKRLQTV